MISVSGTVRRGITMAAIAALVGGGLAGCGGSSPDDEVNRPPGQSQASESLDAASAERFVWRFFREQERACSRMSNAFILDNDGAGEEGRQQCKRTTERGEPAGRVQSVAIEEVRDGRATVTVEDSRGQRAEIELIERRDRWLLHDLRAARRAK